MPRRPHARSASVSDLGAGSLLADKYRIEAVLGEGGMGIVLKATHLELGCPVAIKVMRPQLAHSEDAVNRLLVEARAAASIRSEHVARVLDVGRLENGAPFLVLEHLEGRDLARMLQKSGRLACQVAVDFVLQACQALSEAHSAGIIHRDLKPENLFLSCRADGTPIIKLLDFGISKRLTCEGREAARTNPSELLGSPLYMAPEQMKGGGPIDARADIWSLGVVLYELCTGQSPFFGETIPSICARVIGVDPVPPHELLPTLPEGLEAVILRCLQKNPAERPANIAELAAELAPYGSEDATAYAASARLVIAGARTDPALERPSFGLSETLAVFGQGLRVAPRRRIQPQVTAVGAALACATVLGGAFTWRSGQAREANLQPALPAVSAHAGSEATPAPTSSASIPPAARPARLVTSASKPGAVRVVNLEPSSIGARKRGNSARNAWDPKSFGGRL